ncbi:MAG: hydrogenase nickel incorporation protein HypB [Clostridiales Family XIII bacterium]|jgi:hydrogenase nickel incorporation protein HypB|nr:hydrogenase nickel incorporation protein HypB [Clostridiales Family XIII bacterium]
MNTIRILEIKKSVYENNDLEADKLRADLKQRKTFLINLMSSPGSGKTSSVLRIAEKLKDAYKIGVMEADIDSAVDAQTVADAGIPVIQIHTGGMCHLDAEMTRQGADSPEMQGLDFVILENVGNLVCPAEFDTGASKNMMILSVPEGDDKPLKYPLMFSKVDLLLINKIDTISLFDFDFDAVEARVRKRNPGIKIMKVSAKTGEGFDEVAAWFRTEIDAWNTTVCASPS